MKKKKVGLYVLMCRDPQDILNANKKTQGNILRFLMNKMKLKYSIIFKTQLLIFMK